MNSYHVIINQLAHKVKHIINDSDLERISIGYLDGGALSNNYSFDTLLSDDDAKGNLVVVSWPTSF